MKLSSGQFETLALEQMDTLYRMARRLTRDVNRANDLVQDTFVRALRAKQQFDLQEFGIRPWLLRIMNNLYLTQGQRDARQPVASDEAHLDAINPRVLDVPLPIDPASFEAMDEQ